jgi:hypothetical protein
MLTRTGTARLVTTTRTYKGKVDRSHLLRRSYREGGTVLRNFMRQAARRWSAFRWNFNR